MGNLGDVLQKKIKNLGIGRQVEAADVCERATTEIAKFISKEDFEVVSFKNGVLKVKTSSSVVASEIRTKLGPGFKKKHIEIKRVIFVLG